MNDKTRQKAIDKIWHEVTAQDFSDILDTTKKWRWAIFSPYRLGGKFEETFVFKIYEEEGIHDITKDESWA